MNTGYKAVLWDQGNVLDSHRESDRALAPMYGAYAYFSLQTGHWVGKYVSEQALVKAALGPNLVGNAFNMFFFVNNTVGEKEKYSMRALGRHYRSLFLPTKAQYKEQDIKTNSKERFYERFKEKICGNVPWREYGYSVVGTLTFWNAFQSVNYSYISEELQTPASLGVAFGWTVFLSLWSLLGRRKVVSEHKNLS